MRYLIANNKFYFVLFCLVFSLSVSSKEPSKLESAKVHIDKYGVGSFLKMWSTASAELMPLKLDSQVEMLRVFSTSKMIHSDIRLYKLKKSDIIDLDGMEKAYTESNANHWCNDILIGYLMREYGVSYKNVVHSMDYEFLFSSKINKYFCN